MKYIGLLIILFALAGCARKIPMQPVEGNAPSFMIGVYEDDYGIQYMIEENMWLQKPDTRYHIVRWNVDEGYLLALNDSDNPSDGGLWTRIDWMRLDMPPYEWAFCISTYNAPRRIEAEERAIANRETPRTGCNGYPFSRMKVSNQ
ncbi:MAG: hypothetical protein KTR29_16065 [Rhodothermaceae bacterium]|nr:hypothetical protein [Rhodothermaceae bacterium]